MEECRTLRSCSCHARDLSCAGKALGRAIAAERRQRKDLPIADRHVWSCLGGQLGGKRGGSKVRTWLPSHFGGQVGFVSAALMSGSKFCSISVSVGCISDSESGIFIVKLLRKWSESCPEIAHWHLLVFLAVGRQLSELPRHVDDCRR